MEEQKVQPVDPKQRIMKAAEELFAIEGYDAVSIRKIADKAQVNSAMLYYYFGSKLDLFQKIVVLPINELNDLLENEVDQGLDTLDRLNRYVKCYASFFLQRRYTTEIMTRVILFKDPLSFDKVLINWAKQHKILEAILKEGIAAGIFRNFDIVLASFNIRSSIINYINMSLIFGPPGKLKYFANQYDNTLAEEILDQFLNGALNR